MKSFLYLISIAFFSWNALCQELKPYNDDLYFKVINENEMVLKVDSLKAIIIVFNNLSEGNAKQSIINNPQLKEIKLISPSQDFIQLISELKMDSLTHLFIEEYNGSKLILPAFSTLEHLTIQSKNLTTLSMENASLNRLDILDIDAPELIDWKSEKYFPNLGLIELKAPKLDYFPIEQMPNIFQFSYYCSFKNWPTSICSYQELTFISFENYKTINIDKCLKKKIKKGVFSNVTIYDKIDGQKMLEVESRDRKKFN